MKRAKKSELLRLWIEDHTNILGLALAVLLGVTLIGLMEFPIGPVERVDGVVQEVGSEVRKSVPYPVAEVRIRRGGLVRVRLEGGDPCKPGDPIVLHRQRRVWGFAYAPQFMPCRATSRARAG